VPYSSTAEEDDGADDDKNSSYTCYHYLQKLLVVALPALRCDETYNDDRRLVRR
jgi:hypothetical protein